MSREIERKFLVADDGWRRHVLSVVRIRDGLLAFRDGRKVRVRFYDDRATLTIKGPHEGLARDEFEYEIPASDAAILFQKHCHGEVLEKTRHHLKFSGFDWSVDEYHGLLGGVIYAEIELPSVSTRFPLPPWIGPEVTGQPQHRKINLVIARGGSPVDLPGGRS